MSRGVLAEDPVSYVGALSAPFQIEEPASTTPHHSIMFFLVLQTSEHDELCSCLIQTTSCCARLML